MHKYLKAIGFTELKKKQGIREILKQTADEFDLQRAVSLDETSEFCELKKQYGDNVGISVYGEMDQDKIFEREYYVPYFEGSGITTYADVLVAIPMTAFPEVCISKRESLYSSTIGSC